MIIPEGWQPSCHEKAARKKSINLSMRRRERPKDKFSRANRVWRFKRKKRPFISSWPELTTKMHHFRVDAGRMHEYCKEALLSGLCSNPGDPSLFPQFCSSRCKELCSTAPKCSQPSNPPHLLSALDVLCDF